MHADSVHFVYHRVVTLMNMVGIVCLPVFCAGEVLQIKDRPGSDPAGRSGPVRVRVEAVERRGHTQVVGGRAGGRQWHSCAR